MRSTCSFSKATCEVAGLKQSGLAGSAALPAAGTSCTAFPSQHLSRAAQHPAPPWCCLSPRTTSLCCPPSQPRGPGVGSTICHIGRAFIPRGGDFIHLSPSGKCRLPFSQSTQGTPSQAGRGAGSLHHVPQVGTALPPGWLCRSLQHIQTLLLFLLLLRPAACSKVGKTGD